MVVSALNNIFSFELARINSLDIALGALMTVNAKGTFKVKAQLKMNGISFDLKMANEAANILRPKFKKLRIPRGKNDSSTMTHQVFLARRYLWAKYVLANVLVNALPWSRSGKFPRPNPNPFFIFLLRHFLMPKVFHPSKWIQTVI